MKNHLINQQNYFKKYIDKQNLILYNKYTNQIKGVNYED